MWLLYMGGQLRGVVTLRGSTVCFCACLYACMFMCLTVYRFVVHCLTQCLHLKRKKTPSFSTSYVCSTTRSVELTLFLSEVISSVFSALTMTVELLRVTCARIFAKLVK